MKFILGPGPTVSVLPHLSLHFYRSVFALLDSKLYPNMPTGLSLETRGQTLSVVCFPYNNQIPRY
jgi:hypothetical protein